MNPLLEHIRKFIDENKLVDHQGLQGYFTKRIEKILTKLNRMCFVFFSYSIHYFLFFFVQVK